MKRYYMAMKLREWAEVTDVFGDTHKVPVGKNDDGIVGVIPVFTNKKKARKWGEICEISIAKQK